MVDSKIILVIAGIAALAFLFFRKSGTQLDPIQQANQDVIGVCANAVDKTACQQNYLVEHGVPVGTVVPGDVWNEDTASYTRDYLTPVEDAFSDIFARLTPAERLPYEQDARMNCVNSTTMLFDAAYCG